jgi:hypothetical protein
MLHAGLDLSRKKVDVCLLSVVSTRPWTPLMYDRKTHASQ